VKFIGDTANTLEILPPLKRSVASFSKIEIPYAFKLLEQEMNGYLNMGMRVLTEKDVKHFRQNGVAELTADEEERLLSTALPERVLLDTEVPEMIPPSEEPEVKLDDLTALGATIPEEIVPVPVAANSVPLPKSNMLTIQLPSGMDMMSASGQPAPLNAPALNAPLSALKEDTMDDLPYADDYGEQAPAPMPQPSVGRQNPVNVQTTSQPVLVIPMNIGTSAATELIQPPMPGAPATLAVDTSARAMSSLNLQPSQEPRSRSNSPGKRFSGNGNPGAVVTVKREGATAAPSSNPNVRVSVTKQG
jgi:hypothetical protein